MFSKLLISLSQPGNILLLSVMFISGYLFFRGVAKASHTLGLSCEMLPMELNARKSKALMLHQADDLRLQLTGIDEAASSTQQTSATPFIRGIANTSQLLIEAGELTGDAFKGLLIKIEKMAKKTNPLILIDQDERMAKHLAKKLAKEGWDVKFLQGGLNEWLEKKLPCINIYQDVKVLGKNKSAAIAPANKKQKKSS